MDGTTAFRVLGVSPGASKQTIKKTFRRLAQSAHPDVSGSADEFRYLKQAYDIAFALAPSQDAASGPAVDSVLGTAASVKKATAKRASASSTSKRSSARPSAGSSPRPSSRRQAATGRAPWLTTVLNDFPATATYESLVGAVRQQSEPSMSQGERDRGAEFADHLARAMATAA